MEDTRFPRPERSPRRPCRDRTASAAGSACVACAGERATPIRAGVAAAQETQQMAVMAELMGAGPEEMQAEAQAVPVLFL